MICNETGSWCGRVMQPALAKLEKHTSYLSLGRVFHAFRIVVSWFLKCILYNPLSFPRSLLLYKFNQNVTQDSISGSLCQYIYLRIGERHKKRLWLLLLGYFGGSPLKNKKGKTVRATIISLVIINQEKGRKAYHYFLDNSFILGQTQLDQEKLLYFKYSVINWLTW